MICLACSRFRKCLKLSFQTQIVHIERAEKTVQKTIRKNHKYDSKSSGIFDHTQTSNSPPFRLRSIQYILLALLDSLQELHLFEVPTSSAIRIKLILQFGRVGGGRVNVRTPIHGGHAKRRQFLRFLCAWKRSKGLLGLSWTGFGALGRRRSILGSFLVDSTRRRRSVESWYSKVSRVRT